MASAVLKVTSDAELAICRLVEETKGHETLKYLGPGCLVNFSDNSTPEFLYSTGKASRSERAPKYMYYLVASNEVLKKAQLKALEKSQKRTVKIMAEFVGMKDRKRLERKPLSELYGSLNDVIEFHGMIYVGLNLTKSKISLSLFSKSNLLSRALEVAKTEDGNSFTLMSSNELHCILFSMVFSGERGFTLRQNSELQTREYDLLQFDSILARDESRFTNYFLLNDEKTRFLKEDEFPEDEIPFGAIILKDATFIGVLNFDNGHPSPLLVGDRLETSTGRLQQQQQQQQLNQVNNRTLHDQPQAVTEDKASMQTFPQEEAEKHLLNNALDAHGLQIRRPHVKIPADGNCLFHATADQLGQPGHTYKSLRALAVKELQKNLVDKHLPLDLENFLINNDVETYLQEMSYDKVWGGNPELVALSHGLSRTIRVVTAAEKPEEAIRQFGNFDGSPILLGFADHHYYSLEPMQPPRDGLSHDNDDGNQASTCTSKSSAEVSRTKQHLAPKPEASEKHPSTNFDEQPDSVCIDGIHYRADREEDWLNTRWLLTKLREKCNECNKQRRQIEFNEQKISRLKQKELELKFALMAVQEENIALREVVEGYENREGSVEDSSSSTGVKAEELSVASTSNSKRASGVSSEDEPFMDALNLSL